MSVVCNATALFWLVADERLLHIQQNIATSSDNVLDCFALLLILQGTRLIRNPDLGHNSFKLSRQVQSEPSLTKSSDAHFLSVQFLRFPFRIRQGTKYGAPTKGIKGT